MTKSEAILHIHELITEFNKSIRIAEKIGDDESWRHDCIIRKVYLEYEILPLINGIDSLE